MATEINVISYNISVFSAMGFFGDTVKSTFGPPTPSADVVKGYYPSEARFLRRATKANEFFDNAIGHLAKNVDELDAKLIGIQEYNDETLQQYRTALDKPDSGREYEYVPFTKDIFNNAKLLTIFDKKTFGEKEGVYEADLGLTQLLNGVYIFKPFYTEIKEAKETDPRFSANPPGDSGRPISIIKTKKGYFLMNFQGPNRLRLANPYIDVGPLLRDALQIHFRNAEQQWGKIDTNKLIITCDSNDKKHKLIPLHFKHVEFTDGHNGKDGAISCCYNIDSCGIDKEGDAGFQGPTVVQSMDKFGLESKYIYTGDYVLASHIVRPVEAVDSPVGKDGASNASDHKLVYATVSIPAPTTDATSAAPGGGSKRRQTKRRTKRGTRSKRSKRKNKRRTKRN